MAVNVDELRQNLSYQTRASITEILADIDTLAGLNQENQFKRKEYGKKSLYYFWGLVGLIVGYMVLLIITTVNPIITAIAMILAIFLIVSLIYAFTRKGKYNQLCLIDNRYELARQILQMLSRDIDTNSQVDIYISFWETKNKKNLTETIPHPQKPQWKIDNFTCEWLRVEGQFLDRTKFNLKATSLMKKMYGWKRSRSGKNKYKSKEKKIGLDVSLILNYPVKRYGAVKVLQNEIMNAIKLPDFAIIRTCKNTEKSMILLVRIPDGGNYSVASLYQTITMMFLSLYQVLNLAKILSK